MRKAALYLTAVLFAVYVSVMLWMMIFGRIGTVVFDSYGNYLKEHTSFVPLRFAFDYIGSVQNEGIYNYRLGNIIGNTVLFIPLGIFLPCFFKSICSLKKLFVSVTIIILVIELVQLIFLLGSFDVDDIILNCLGASVGYWLYRCIRQK